MITEPPRELKDRLLKMGLMMNIPGDEKKNRFLITSRGYKFLFKNRHAQVWDFVLSYMNKEDLEIRRMRRDEVLSFLFRLSFLRIGQFYSTKSLTETQRIVVLDLTLFGLIYQSKSSSRRYYPTSLSINLSTSSSIPSSSSLRLSSQGYILTETSFKLYAFTNLPYQIALLKLFARHDYTLPNMIVLRITKQSVRRALKSNISAQEIITFLEDHAHPEQHHHQEDGGVVGVGGGGGGVPANVSDQIRLWELERNRLTTTLSHLCEFEAQPEEYPKIESLVRQYDVILWSDDSKKLLVTTERGFQVIKAYRKGGMPGVLAFTQSSPKPP